jgi:hypothetical protein
MSRKQLIQNKIRELGLETTVSILGIPLLELIDYTDYPIDNPDILLVITTEIFKETYNKPGGHMYYKEFTISFNNLESLVSWDDVLYVDSHGGGPSFEFYATPFYDGQSVIPIALANVWVNGVDGEPEDIINFIGNADDYHDMIEITNFDFKNTDDVRKWIVETYMPKTYKSIKFLMKDVIKNENLI